MNISVVVLGVVKNIYLDWVYNKHLLNKNNKTQLEKKALKIFVSLTQHLMCLMNINLLLGRLARNALDLV